MNTVMDLWVCKGQRVSHSAEQLCKQKYLMVHDVIAFLVLSQYVVASSLKNE